MGDTTKWCAEGELNPHGVTHMVLSHTRLPIPPSAHKIYISFIDFYFVYLLSFLTEHCGHNCEKNFAYAKNCVRHPRKRLFYKVKSFSLSRCLTCQQSNVGWTYEKKLLRNRPYRHFRKSYSTRILTKNLYK